MFAGTFVLSTRAAVIHYANAVSAFYRLQFNRHQETEVLEHKRVYVLPEVGVVEIGSEVIRKYRLKNVPVGINCNFF